MSLGWKEPEFIKRDEAQPWYKNGLTSTIGCRCKYCKTLFVKSTDWLLKILMFVFFIVLYMLVGDFFEGNEILIGVTGFIWLVCLIAVFTLGKYEEIYKPNKHFN